jgi:hypothetical protein
MSVATPCLQNQTKQALWKSVTLADSADWLRPCQRVQRRDRQTTIQSALKALPEGRVPRSRVTAGSSQLANQLLDTSDQPLDCKRLNQIFNVVLSQKESDFGVGREAGDENKTIG